MASERIKLELFVNINPKKGFFQNREMARRRIEEALQEGFPQIRPSVKLPKE